MEMSWELIDPIAQIIPSSHAPPGKVGVVCSRLDNCDLHLLRLAERLGGMASRKTGWLCRQGGKGRHECSSIYQVHSQMRVQFIFYTTQINDVKNLLWWDLHATVDWTQLCEFTWSESISWSSAQKVRIQDFYFVSCAPRFVILMTPHFAAPQKADFASPGCWIAWDTFGRAASSIGTVAFEVHRKQNLQLRGLKGGLASERMINKMSYRDHKCHRSDYCNIGIMILPT